MLSCYYVNARLFAKDDFPDELIKDNIYLPKYESAYDVISEIDFISLFDKLISKKKTLLNEHELIEKLKNNSPNWFQPYLLNDYRLFIHWYERKYKTNVMNENLCVNINDFTDLWLNEKNKISDNYSKFEIIRLIYENINIYSSSKKHKGFSLFYEVYFEAFPDIENLSFKEFTGIELIKYIINLYPLTKGISSNQLHYIRFPFELEEDYKYDGGIFYSGREFIPSFLPNVLNKLRTIDKKELQNLLRTNIGLPRIGEGWISETDLYYKLKSRIIDFEIIHHGKPDFLGRQHLDIWIPELKIGIEYHGAQHDRPVDFFGGQEAYEKNVERDKRKKELCIENGVKLIEVREGYNLDDLLIQILNER